MELFSKIEVIVKSGAALAVLVFFAVATYVVWPYRQLPTQTATLTKAYTDAAPSKGKLDSGIDALTQMLPDKKNLDTLVATATATVKQAQPIEENAADAIKDTAHELNRPCQGPDGPGACGAIQTVNKTVIKAGDAIVTTQIEERKVGPHIIGAMDQVRDDATQLDVVLKDQAIHNAAANLSAALGNLSTDEQTGNGILLDIKTETDEMAKPKTKGQKFLEVLPPALRLGYFTYCIATHTPCL